MRDTSASSNEGFTLWLTGLSGAGKSTLARMVADGLRAQGRRVEVLDGDEVRAIGLGLGFSKEDRDKNVALIGYVARLLSRNGVVAIVAAISPFRSGRDGIRLAHDGRFIEAFVDCPLDALIGRDPKGLYAKALRGEIQGFSGVSDPYEEPRHPEIHLHTGHESSEVSGRRIVEYLRDRGFIAP